MPVEEYDQCRGSRAASAASQSGCTLPSTRIRVQPTNETAYAVYPWLKTAYPDVKRVANMGPSDEAGFTETEDRRMIAGKNGFRLGGDWIPKPYEASSV